MKRILFIHSCDIKDPKRGTPIRIREVLDKLRAQADFEVATYDAGGKRLGQKLKELRRMPQEIFFGNTHMDWWTLVFSKLLYGKKIAIDLHGSMEEELYASGLIPAWKKILLKWAYRRTIGWFDLVSFVNTLLRQHVGAKHPNAVIMYPGYNAELFKKILHEPHAPNNVLRIGYIGNARGYQGTEHVLRIAKQLAREQLPFSLRIISSEEKEMRQMMASELGTAPAFLEEIYNLPHAEALARIAECDVLLVLRPKNIVTDLCFPSKLPEYLATGRTVILSDFADVKSLLSHGRDAYLVNAENREQEAYACIKKIILKELPLLDPATVRQSAEKIFSLDNVARQLIERLRNL